MGRKRVSWEGAAGPPQTRKRNFNRERERTKSNGRFLPHGQDVRDVKRTWVCVRTCPRPVPVFLLACTYASLRLPRSVWPLCYCLTCGGCYMLLTLGNETLYVCGEDKGKSRYFSPSVRAAVEERTAGSSSSFGSSVEHWIRLPHTWRIFSLFINVFGSRHIPSCL